MTAAASGTAGRRCLRAAGGGRAAVDDSWLHVEEGGGLEAVLDRPLALSAGRRCGSGRGAVAATRSRTRCAGRGSASRVSAGDDTSLSSVATGWPRLLTIVSWHSIRGSTSVTSTAIARRARRRRPRRGAPAGVADLEPPHERLVRRGESRSVALEQVVGGHALERAQVMLDRLGDRRVGHAPPRSSRIAAVAQRLDDRQVVGDEEHGAALCGDLAHLAQAFLLEGGVADREDLVDEQDLRLEVRGDGEREPHVHPARVALDRRVEEALDLGEVDDLVELRGGSRLAACRGSRRSGRCSRGRSARGGSRCRPRAASRRGRGRRRSRPSAR